MNSDLQGILVVGVFAAMFLSVPYWFWLIRRLDRHMKAHHPALHRALGVGDLLPGNVSEATDFDNSEASMSLARFLWQRDDRVLNDETLSRIVTRMRLFGACFLSGFVILIGIGVSMELG